MTHAIVIGGDLRSSLVETLRQQMLVDLDVLADAVAGVESESAGKVACGRLVCCARTLEQAAL